MIEPNDLVQPTDFATPLAEIGLTQIGTPSAEVTEVADNIVDANIDRILECEYAKHFISAPGERSHVWRLTRKLNADGVVNGKLIGEFFFQLSLMLVVSTHSIVRCWESFLFFMLY